MHSTIIFQFHKLIGFEVVVNSQPHFGRPDPFTNKYFFDLGHFKKKLNGTTFFTNTFYHEIDIFC